MKRFFFRLPMVVALALGITLPVLADTIRLKDGSVIRGQIVSFKNEQFTILVGSGARGRKSRITVYMEDVESIEFDAAGTAGTEETSTASNTQSQPPYQPPVDTRPANTSTQQPANTSAPPTFFTVNVRVRADNSANGWTTSGLVVWRGQRLRISASGRVSLGKDPTTGRDIWVTPDGLPNRPDNGKLMRREPTGGLVAVIGDDNDDFIYIGRSHDFVAQRDGTLFLGVNEGNLNDNSGTFDIVIEAEAKGAKSP